MLNSKKNNILLPQKIALYFHCLISQLLIIKLLLPVKVNSFCAENTRYYSA